MTKNRFSWHRDEEAKQRGGWENADSEFTQVSFSNPSQNVDEQNAEETSFANGVNNCEDDVHVPVDNQNASKSLKRFHDQLSSNRSHFLCTLLPSRKAYRENPALDHTMSRKKSLKRVAPSTKSTMSLRRRSRSAGVIQCQLSEDEVDLQMENIQEGDYWEQLIAIKNMPASMSVKMEYKKELEKLNIARDSTSSSWKSAVKKNRQKITDFKDEFQEKLNLWHNPMKVIEGHYGTGIVSYFFFLRWLLMLNIIMFALLFFFVILPEVSFRKLPLLANVSDTNQTRNGTITLSVPQWYWTYEEASSNYTFHVLSKTQATFKGRMQDLIQGTGWMELTVMFYGGFKPNDLFIGKIKGTTPLYRLPLAYLVITILYLFICMVMMVRNMVKSSQEKLVLHEGQFYRYFNLSFSSWDFCITDPDSADLKQKNIYVDIQSNLKEDIFTQKQDQRSTPVKLCLLLTRILLNLLSLCILIGAGYLIYFVVIQSTELKKKHESVWSKPAIMLLEFLTPLTITALNLILPILFNVMADQERYRPDTKINLTLFRSVFVRLASLAVLMITFAEQIACKPSDDNCVHILCWETYVGQEMYKLIIVDFVVVIFITVVVESLRRFVVVKFSNFKLSKIVGKPEFDIAKHVLDLIYAQTVCWLGVFYCPMLPAIGVIKNVIFFYAKKYSLLRNCQPAVHAYKSSKSNTFFFLVLLLAFFLSCVPLIYSFTVFHPSKGCGPFRLDDNMWDEITESISAAGIHLRRFSGFLFSAGFAIPLFVILCFLIYYYVMLKSAYNELMMVLKDRLKDEGKDKQYLLARLTEIVEKEA